MPTSEDAEPRLPGARPASAVVHELNNLLTAIRGYAQLAREGLEEGDPARDDLDRVLEAAGRAVNLTRQLLDASIPAHEQPDPTA